MSGVEIIAQAFALTASVLCVFGVCGFGVLLFRLIFLGES